MEGKNGIENFVRDVQKLEIRKENLYDNSKGSTLLFGATAGYLRTKSFVGKYKHNDGACVVCEKERETIRHIVLDCECIYPNLYDVNIRLPEALEFKGRIETVNHKPVDMTKRRLECWCKKTLDGNIA